MSKQKTSLRAKVSTVAAVNANFLYYFFVFNCFAMPFLLRAKKFPLSLFDFSTNKLHNSIAEYMYIRSQRVNEFFLHLPCSFQWHLHVTYAKLDAEIYRSSSSFYCSSNFLISFYLQFNCFFIYAGMTDF